MVTISELAGSMGLSRSTLLSKNMNDHDRYMEGFMQVFSGLECWGPGSLKVTEQALASLPIKPQSILEVGCGNGIATMLLAQHSGARVTALDTDESALARVRGRAIAAGVTDRIDTLCLDMARLSEVESVFDAIWAEGSAYIIGVKRALSSWRPLLRPGGCLVLSDMVWRASQPSEDVQTFWASEYPAMATVEKRLKQAERAGYTVHSHLDMGQAALDAYYLPLAARLEQVKNLIAEKRVVEDLQRELDVYHQGKGQFGYEMFVLIRD